MAQHRAHVCTIRATYCQCPLLTPTQTILFITINPEYVSTPLFSYLSGGDHHNLFKVVQSHDCGVYDSLQSTRKGRQSRHTQRTHARKSDTRGTALPSSQRHPAEGGATLELELQNQVVKRLI